MSELTFAAGVWRYVAAAAVVALAVVYALDFTRRRRALERIGHLPTLRRMMPALSEERRTVKAVLRVAGIALVLLALARPQLPGEKKWKKRGIDVAVVMDYSKSMLAKDVPPSRVERMEREVVALLDDERLQNDRVAVVVFAGAAAHFPLTHDHEAAKLLFEGLTPLEMPPGSDLGEALRRARCIVRPDLLDDPSCERVGGRGRGGAPLTGDADEQHDDLPTDQLGVERARAIVVFTDGEDTEGHAREEVARAAELGIDVLFVGVGTPEGEMIPEYDPDSSGPLFRRDVIGWKKTPDGKSFVFTRLEEGALRELAAVAGGDDHYLRLDPKQIHVDAIADRLERLKVGDLDERLVAIPREVYQWLLFPGFVLLWIEAVMTDRRRRRRK
ncbi:MAG: VWA domain-containing protein [Deltaproteobacteria bacterium]|nr:MAG: VWA domain-containing protein [Deltaproteobacteria bacterium]